MFFVDDATRTGAARRAHGARSSKEPATHDTARNPGLIAATAPRSEGHLCGSRSGCAIRRHIERRYDGAKGSPLQLNATFAALSDAFGREMIRLLLHKAQTRGELAESVT